MRHGRVSGAAALMGRPAGVHEGALGLHLRVELLLLLVLLLLRVLRSAVGVGLLRHGWHLAVGHGAVTTHHHRTCRGRHVELTMLHGWGHAVACDVH